MPPISRGTMTWTDIKRAARATAAALAACGLAGCLCGGTACRLYGTTRTPNVSPSHKPIHFYNVDRQDIDIVIMDSILDQEDIKRRIVAADSAFFLVASTNYRNHYKILWYNLDTSGSPGSRACKVDILVPGIMCIPGIAPRQRVSFKRGENKPPMPPGMPLLPLLFLKLQAWSDHRSSLYANVVRKQYVDAVDIEELLEVCLGKLKERLKGARVLELPASFVEAGKRRIAEFCLYYPATKTKWRALDHVFFDRRDSGHLDIHCAW